MSTKELVAWVLVVGAVNWGLVGLMGLNLVDSVFGTGSMLARIVYVVVGLAGVYKAYMMVGGKKKR